LLEVVTHGVLGHNLDFHRYSPSLYCIYDFMFLWTAEVVVATRELNTEGNF